MHAGLAKRDVHETPMTSQVKGAGHKPRIPWVVSMLLLGLALYLAADVYLSTGPSIECRFPAARPLMRGIAARTLTSGGFERCYLVYTPPGHDPARASPVVVALHGFAGNARGFRSIAVWEPIADREDFIVVYPEGSSFPLRWNIGPQANIPAVDDVRFLRDVLADLPRVAAIDLDRVYLTGFSNGGGMAHRMACQLSDRIAAVGIVDAIDGGMLGECATTRPVPLMAFFGAANPLTGLNYPIWFQRLMDVSMELAPPLPPYAVNAWVQAWANRNGCTVGPVTLPPQGSATGIRYEGCREDAWVVLYWIEGQGHAWPGGPAILLLGKSVTDINASEVMWAFFRDHPLTSGSEASPPDLGAGGRAFAKSMGRLTADG